MCVRGAYNLPMDPQKSVASIRTAFGSADPESYVLLCARHADDGRPGVQAAVAAARRRLDRERAVADRHRSLAAREEALYASGCLVVAGVDEVGRGALAGPVTAGACVFAPGTVIPGLADSKKLTPAARERLDGLIRASALRISVAHVAPGRIDAVGIAAATVAAMRDALQALGCAVDHALVDGLPVDLGVPSTAVIKGDDSVRAIAAASIVAKVARDALMVALDAEHPGYGLAGNKGYGSSDHLSALESLGPCPIHRMSFGPCCSPRLFTDG